MAGNLSLTREYNRIFSIMIDKVQPLLFDNISARTSALFRMKDMGAIQVIDGAPLLRFNILKELPATEAYTDLGTLTPVRADPYTSIAYEWKQLNVPVQVSGLDMIKQPDGNSPDLLATFIEAAEISMRDAIGGSALGIYSDAGESDLTKISGLQNMLQTSTTTGTVGQLSRASTEAWRHKSGNVAGDFSANGINAFRTLYRQCSRNDETPDSILLNGATYDNYERDLTSTLQVNLPLKTKEASSRMMDAGFDNIRYKNALVFPDDGVPANFGYFMNFAKFTRLLVRKGRDAEISDFVKSRTQDDLAAFILWAGNLITTNLRGQGVLLNGDTY